MSRYYRHNPDEPIRHDWLAGGKPVNTTEQLTLDQARRTGEVQADACLEKTRQTQENWPERAYVALLAYITIKRDAGAWSAEKAVDFILHQPGIEKPHDERAFGSLFSKAARAGLIFRTNVPYHRTKGHGSQGFCWESA